MAISNAERVGKALEYLREGLVPFVEREMQDTHGAKEWLKKAKDCFNTGQKTTLKEKPHRWDTYALLQVMNNQWNLVFKKVLSKSDRSLVMELQDFRNRYAHEENFSSDDALRALEDVKRLLEAVSAPQATEVAKMRQEIMRTLFAEQERTARRRSTASSIE